MTTTCTRCHRPLKQPHCQERGYGDICWGRKQYDDARREQEEDANSTIVGPGDDLIFGRHGGIACTNVPYREHMHSRNFEWGYAGSGPADLALNVLLECGVGRREALSLHQDFKSVFISTLPHEGGVLCRQVVRDWVSQQPKL